MSSDEQALQEGKTLIALRAARRQLGNVHSRSSEIATHLLAVGNAFQHKRYDAPGIGMSISQLPTQEELQQLITDAQAAKRAIKDAMEQIALTGIEIK